MKKRTIKNINGLLAVSLAATPVLAMPAEKVSASSITDIIAKLDSVYDSLTETDRQVIRDARSEFLLANDATWAELSTYITVEGLTETEKQEIITGLTNVIYATTADELGTAVLDFSSVYSSTLETKFDMTFSEFLTVAVTFETEVLALVETYKTDLQNLDQTSQEYNTTVENLLNQAYSNALTTLKADYSTIYNKVSPVITLDSNGLFGTLVGINSATGIDNQKILDAQKVLIEAVLAEIAEPEPTPTPTPSPTPDPEPEEPVEEDPVLEEPTDEEPAAEDEVAVDNDTVTVEKTINEEGKAVVKVTVNSEKLTESIKDKNPEDVAKVSIKVKKGEAGEVSDVSVPSAAFNAVKEKNPNAVVEISNEDASYSLPVNEIDTDELAAELGDGTTSDDVEISIQVNEVDEEVATDLVGKSQLKTVSKVIEFDVIARTKDGKKSKQIKRFKKYVERSINSSDGENFNVTNTTAVRFNDDGTFAPIPTLFNGNSATLKSLTNSKYTIVSNDMTFTDITDTWNKEQIEKLASKYIVQGFNDGTFDPQSSITRKEFTALISRALGLVPEFDYDGQFADVKEDKWYAEAVQTAVEAGIIQGREDGSFDPDGNITRTEAATMIKRAMDFVSYDESKLNDAKEASSYNDYNEIATWARPNVELLLEAGIMNGRGNGNFDPYGNITRAEMVKVLDTFLVFSNMINE